MTPPTHDIFTHGKFALSLKLTRNNTTHKSTFAGGNAKFTATLNNGSWASTWAAAGMDVSATAKNTPATVTLSITVDGTWYQITAPVLFSAKAGKGGFEKK